MAYQWPEPKANIEEFQREYFLAYGRSKAYEELVRDLSGADERIRMIAIKIEQENVKQQLATPKQSR